MTDMTRTLKMIADCDDEVHFERQVKRELLRLHDLIVKTDAMANTQAARIAELEANLKRCTSAASDSGGLTMCADQKWQQQSAQEVAMPDKSNVHWPIYDVMPDGWRFDRTCGSPLAGYEFASDGVSILRGGKRALVAASVKKMDDPVYTYTPAIKQEKAKPLDDAARLAMNNLARANSKISCSKT